MELPPTPQKESRTVKVSNVSAKCQAICLHGVFSERGKKGECRVRGGGVSERGNVRADYLGGYFEPCIIGHPYPLVIPREHPVPLGEVASVLSVLSGGAGGGDERAEDILGWGVFGGVEGNARGKSLGFVFGI